MNKNELMGHGLSYSGVYIYIYIWIHMDEVDDYKGERERDYEVGP